MGYILREIIEAYFKVAIWSDYKGIIVASGAFCWPVLSLW